MTVIKWPVSKQQVLGSTVKTICIMLIKFPIKLFIELLSLISNYLQKHQNCNYNTER